MTKSENVCGGCGLPKDKEPSVCKRDDGIWRCNDCQKRLDREGLRRNARPIKPVGEHIVDGEFQSDKYPTTPRGKVPLSVKDPTAQGLLWEYAQRHRHVDAAFADDLETCLRNAGFVPEDRGPRHVFENAARATAAQNGFEHEVSTAARKHGVSGLVVVASATFRPDAGSGTSDQVSAFARGSELRAALLAKHAVAVFVKPLLALLSREDEAPNVRYVEERGHIVPRSKGGDDALPNLRLAHERCNVERGDGFFDTHALK